METDNREETKRYIKARKRVDKLKEFYQHLTSYMVMVPFLVFINYMTYWEFKWFWFALFGWGIGLVIHGFITFSYYNDWEERKIKKLMEKDNY